MRAAIVALMLVLACGGEGTKGTVSGSSSDTASTAPTTDPGDPDHPSGASCPLVGLFVDCASGGQTYCDEIDGALRFGPCITEPVCDISGSPSCEMHCELVDGVPTWISDENGCATSGVE